VFLVDYDFATINTNGELLFDIEMMKLILNLYETCMSLDRGNGNRGGRPTVTYYGVCFPQLGKATSKLALTTTMIGESNAVGKPIPPHFQFKTSAQTPDANHFVSSVSVTCSMCNRRSVTKRFQSFPISLGLYNKGGMDDVEFFEYLQKSIMKLYPDATPVKGKWVVIKCDSSPGRLNPDLLVYLRYHGFLLYPGVPNTTAVLRETDQSFGPFKSAVRTNLQFLVDEQIREDAPWTLSSWIIGLVVFGGCDPETELIVASAFEKGFSKAQNIRAWEQVGAFPLSRKCLQSPKVRRSIGDGNDDQQALVHLIVEHNVIACNALTMEGYNGDVMKITLKPIECTTCRIKSNC
jgi:hypothetical protein